jgi:hypothetical protein
MAWRAAIVPLVVLGAAAYVGYLIAYEVSKGGELRALSYAPVLPLGLVALFLIVVGSRARSTRGRAPASIGSQTLGSGLAIVAGTLAGIWLTPVLGLGYRPPVVQMSSGPGTFVLADASGFEAGGQLTAECLSVPDGSTMQQVAVTNAGSLDGGRLLVVIYREPPEGGGDHIGIDIGGETEGGLIPSWSGPVTISTADAEGRSGTATFESVVGVDPAAKEDPGASPGSIAPWPTTLSGTLTWACGPWETASD